MEEKLKREEALSTWIDQNQKKIKQFFKNKEPDFEDLVRNIDKIDDFEVEIE